MGPLLDSDPPDASMEAALPILLPYLPHRSLLAVQGVCRSWRKTTLEEPSYWKVFNITCFPGRAAHLRDEHLLAWTKRACFTEGVGADVAAAFGKTSREEGSSAENLLTVVDLTGCARLTGEGLLTALRECTNLSKLCLSGCGSVRPSSVVQLVQSLAQRNVDQGRQPQLRSLVIGGLLKEEHDCMLQELLECLTQAARKEPAKRIKGAKGYGQERVDLEELGWHFDHCCPQCRTCSTFEVSACEEGGCPYRGLSSLGKDACDVCRLECPRCERTLCQGCHFDMARCPVCHESKCAACVSACLEGGMMAGDESSDEEDLTVWQA